MMKRYTTLAATALLCTLAACTADDTLTAPLTPTSSQGRRVTAAATIAAPAAATRTYYELEEGAIPGLKVTWDETEKA